MTGRAVLPEPDDRTLERWGRALAAGHGLVPTAVRVTARRDFSGALEVRVELATGMALTEYVAEARLRDAVAAETLLWQVVRDGMAQLAKHYVTPLVGAGAGGPDPEPPAWRKARRVMRLTSGRA